MPHILITNSFTTHNLLLRVQRCYTLKSTCGEFPFLSPSFWGYSMRMNIINCHGIYFLSQEQIAYFLTQEAVHLLVHFKFLRV